MLYYTGIGSRQTPDADLSQMTIIASNLEPTGFILRSGGAKGADTAFENGVTEEDHKEIYLPWKGFNNSKSSRYTITKEALELAAHYHPAWSRCSTAAHSFHARNCYQVLGQDLNTPTQFVLCWTPDGKIAGGTGQAMRIAIDRGIPVINMATPGWSITFDKLTQAILQT